MNFSENISLKPFNTFGIDVKAKYFAEAKTLDDLTEILGNFKSSDIENIQFLGGGSNILFTKDFDGLVVKLDLKGISEEVLNKNEVLIMPGAGENWHNFVMYCLAKNYGGLENLSLIPGNVGASPMQNIGAYGTEIKDVFEKCTVLNLETLETEIFNAEKCRFGYRDSIFKQEGKGKYVILDVTFKLTTQNHQIKTEYGAIKFELEKMSIENPTIQDVANAVISIRQSKLPDPKVLGNAGSFFKNPVIPAELYQNLKHAHPEIPGYGNGETVKVPAAWLIEQCGWKGKQIGNVASNALQPLVIINATGEATGKEIFDFSTQIISSVMEKFGIELEREVNVV